MSVPQAPPLLRVSRICPAPAGRVWLTLTDWEIHHRWMVLTSASGGSGEGARIDAFTGVGPIGFTDPMEITEWRPATDTAAGRCSVRHLGGVVRGEGRFDVRPVSPSHSVVVWTEWADLPFGRLGAAARPLARLLLAPMFRSSLRALGDEAALR
ncbi:polyketide cyclase/dehydrase/lipid transport protein [Murinocardiopsis flavida]|uniref:Polyketide cyclase/dehydrase/lipid transport protein n=1 Tax=Murinocardiopsis flavida TaxID=645275 RepID=A0A2P8DJE8_9ACTN|nr:SRPBCC family protein [Murinocardiopsis flavida]PSK97345.1 polyketide cyclase/dehydrase/lipid transport protein [Murinocardiopsis flavida]